MFGGGAPSKKAKSFKTRSKMSKTTAPANRGSWMTGRVPASLTTQQINTVGPFKPKIFTSFIYEQELAPVSLVTAQGALSVSPNDLYDFDKGTTFGNKQPLFYDTMLTSTGPYRTYKVFSWKTTYTIVNTSATVPVTIWAVPPTNSASEVDQNFEADNFPGVKRLYLTPNAGSKSIGTLTVDGHISDVYDNYKDDSSLIGSFNGSPGSGVYQGLVIRASDGTTVPSVYVAVRHVTYVELCQIDALVS